MATLTFTDTRGRRLQVSEKLGQGGEGAVYRSGQHALKIYHTLPDLPKQQKLKAMAELAQRHPTLTLVSTWPVDVALHGRAVHGVVMPLVSGALPLHELATPASRKRLFPHADLKFVLQVSVNLARAVEALHDAGQVIGDFNPNNILVDQRGQTMLVDTDSFHITAPDGRTYPCLVGMPEYLPPERHGAQLGRFTRQDDVFTLLIHVYMLLYGGWHPFSGRWSTPAPPTLDQAVARRAFPHSRIRPTPELKPPPGAMGLDLLTDTLADLMDRTFTSTFRPGVQDVRAAVTAMMDALTTDGCGHPHVAGRPCGTCLREQRRSSAVMVTVPGTPGWAVQAIETLPEKLSALPRAPLRPPPVQPGTRPGRALAALANNATDRTKVTVIGALQLSAIAAYPLTNWPDMLMPGPDTAPLLSGALVALLAAAHATAFLLRPSRNSPSYIGQVITERINALIQQAEQLERQARTLHNTARQIRSKTAPAAMHQLNPSRTGELRTLHAQATALNEQMRQVQAAYATQKQALDSLKED